MIKLSLFPFRYTFPKFDLCWTVLLDLKLRVPCPSLQIIETEYGKKWIEPVVKEWVWNKGPANIKENGVWPKEEWGEVLQVF